LETARTPIEYSFCNIENPRQLFALSHVYNRCMHHKRSRPPESLLWKYFPFIIVLSLMGTLSIFLFWMVTVVFPVASVELQYQVKKTLADTVGVHTLRGLFFPTFRISFSETSKHELGGVSIPALFLDEPIIFNVDPNNEAIYTAALKQGIAHASSTRLPDTGGLGYYFAHSSSPSLARQYNAVFYLLGKLNGGEKIIVWNEGKPYHYTVYEKSITVKEDVSFLKKEYPEETIVLQTCWPPGTTERRLLIFAKRNEQSF
jgi:LPXTG-site transpeptidase (sortase) family protein